MSDVIVDIWSDVQCPWCFIGKRRFERAARMHDGEVQVTYHSFELAPDTPLDFDGSSIDYLVHRKGMSREEVERMLDHVTALAADEGLAFDFASVHHTNTEQARAYGITGVPFYVLNGQIGVSGAQPSVVFAQALTQAGDHKVKESPTEANSG